MKLHPQFKEFLFDSLGEDVAGKYFEFIQNNISAPPSIRINPFKVSNLLLTSLSDYLEDKVKWCSAAYYLKEKIDFAHSPFFHAGGYYVQDASSMYIQMLEDVLRDYITALSLEKSSRGKTIKVLDFCASPGGKSTHIISLLTRLCSLIDSSITPIYFLNEAVGKRVAPLQENIAKWGEENIVITSDYSQRYFNSNLNDEFFDIAIFDLPCSGEGMFRKSNDAIVNWTPQSVRNLSSLGRDIIDDVWPKIKSNGIIIYSTCTYNHFENSDNVEYLSQKGGININHKIDIALNDHSIIKIKGDSGTINGFQFIPPFVKSEGQFFSVLQKGNIKDRIDVDKPPKKLSRNQSLDELNLIKCSINSHCVPFAKNLKFYLGEDGTIRIFSPEILDALKLIGSSLNVHSFGATLGIVKGNEIIPSAEFALSKSIFNLLSSYQEYSEVKHSLQEENLFVQFCFEKGINLSFYTVQVEEDIAIQFLSKMTIKLPNRPRGYLLLIYKNLPLGFVKNIGERVNNLYPKNWRILK